MVFLSESDARAALKKAGHTGSVSLDGSACSSEKDGRIVEMNVICHQHPPAGRTQGARLPITIRVQRQDPRHGNLGRTTEWHLMPKVVGLHVEKAQAKMREAGFTNTKRIHVKRVSKSGCKPHHVCSTYPEALKRSGQNSDKILRVGVDPNAKPPVVAKPTKPDDTAERDEDADEDDEAEKDKEAPAPDFF